MRNKLYTVCYPIVWLVFKIFRPWRIVGDAKLPEGGVLICGNHSGLSDPLYVLLATGNYQQCRVMAKAELMRVPVLGFILKKAGVFGIDRGKADIQAIKTAMTALKNGERLLLFPEGTRVKEGEEGNAHPGAAMLATRTGVPIVPVYIPRKKTWFKPITLVFGEPYIPAFEGRKATPEDYERITAELMEKIYSLKGRA